MSLEFLKKFRTLDYRYVKPILQMNVFVVIEIFYKIDNIIQE